MEWKKQIHAKCAWPSAPYLRRASSSNVFNLAVSFIFLFLFRGWGVLAEIISVATLISYLTGPVTVMTLRKTGTDLYRPLRIKGLSIIAPLGFVFASLTLYWARWPLTGQVLFIILIGLPIYFYYQAKAKWKASAATLRRVLGWLCTCLS